MSECLFDETVELCAHFEEFFSGSGASLIIRSEKYTSCSTHNVTPGVDNRVAVTRGFPVSHVIVSKLCAKVAHDCAKLGHLQTICFDLWEAGAEFTSGAFTWMDLLEFNILLEVLAHLDYRVSSTLASSKVCNLNGAWDVCRWEAFLEAADSAHD